MELKQVEEKGENEPQNHTSTEFNKTQESVHFQSGGTSR